MKWEQRTYTHKEPVTVAGLVSIVMPTYNRQDALIERIREVRNQSYDNWELIIVNDGSQSMAQGIAGLPAKLDRNFLLTLALGTEPEALALGQKIRVIDLPENSQSVSIPRNIGISWAQGEFIVPADDDVLFFPNKLELLLANLEDKALVYGARSEIDFRGRHEKPVRTVPEFIEDWNPLEGAGIDNGQILYRKSVYEKLPYIISTHACDLHLAKEIYSEFGSFAYVNEIISSYIWHDTNRTNREDRKTSPLDVGKFKDHFNVHNDVKLIRE